MFFFVRFFWERTSSWEVWGTLVPNQRFYHELQFFNTAHRSMIWRFIAITYSQPPEGPSLDSAPKVHISSILQKEFNKEKTYEEPGLGSCFFWFFWEKILLRSMRNPSTKPTVLTWIAMFLKSRCDIDFSKGFSDVFQGTFQSYKSIYFGKEKSIGYQ